MRIPMLAHPVQMTIPFLSLSHHRLQQSAPGGMLVVSVTGVNFGFWPHLGCSEENDIMCSSICDREGLI